MRRCLSERRDRRNCDLDWRMSRKRSFTTTAIIQNVGEARANGRMSAVTADEPGKPNRKSDQK